MLAQADWPKSQPATTKQLASPQPKLCNGGYTPSVLYDRQCGQKKN